jgi:hypothetical protein
MGEPFISRFLPGSAEMKFCRPVTYRYLTE